MNSEKLLAALEGHTIPPLTLDNKWYRLFKKVEKSSEIAALEEELKALMLEQGKMNDEYGKLKSLKTKLMKEIQECMASNDKRAAKTKDKNSKLIDEINEKMAANEDRGLELPREIEQTNKRLMLATMEQCYEMLKDNTEEINSLGSEIEALRIELKKNVVLKQQKEVHNVEIYSYMNDIFGSEVIDLFDISYDIEGNKQELLEKQRALKEQKKKEEASNGKNSDA